MTFEQIIARFADVQTAQELKACFRDAVAAVGQFTSQQQAEVTAAFVAARDRIRDTP